MKRNIVGGIYEEERIRMSTKSAMFQTRIDSESWSTQCLRFAMDNWVSGREEAKKAYTGGFNLNAPTNRLVWEKAIKPLFLTQKLIFPEKLYFSARTIRENYVSEYRIDRTTVCHIMARLTALGVVSDGNGTSRGGYYYCFCTEVVRYGLDWIITDNKFFRPPRRSKEKGVLDLDE